MSDTNNEQDKLTEGTVEELPASDKPTEDAQEPTLPDGAKERTKEEFEKLKETNRTLAEELKALKGGSSNPSSVLDDLRPNMEAAPTVAAPSAESQAWLDEGGYVDTTLLNSELSSAKNDAAEAKRIAKQTQENIQRFQESQVVQVVHSEFPEIDPNNLGQFDPRYYNFVKNELIGQMMSGKKEDLKAAAIKARQILGIKQQQAQTEPRKETISSREQASSPTGTSKGVAEPTNDHEALVEGTLKGDRDAIYKRLQASGN